MPEIPLYRYEVNKLYSKRDEMFKRMNWRIYNFSAQAMCYNIQQPAENKLLYVEVFLFIKRSR